MVRRVRRGGSALLTPARLRLAAIGAGAFALRLVVIAATPGYRPIHDDAAYTRVARSLLSVGHYPGHPIPGGGFQVSAYRPPGWPGVLYATWQAIGFNVTAARVVLALIGAVAAVLVAVLAGQLFGRRAALAAGILAALSPLAIAVGASLESETLFTALILGAACAAMAARRRSRVRWALLAGVLAGLAALTRTNGLVALPVIALLAIPLGVRGPRRLVPAIAALVVAIAVIAPWTMRNARVAHAFIPVSTETGNTLAGTYNDVSLHHDARWLEPRHIGAYRAIFRRDGAEAKADSDLTAAVLRWVRDHPVYPLYVLVQNSGRLLGAGGPSWGAFSLHTMSLGDDAGSLVWLGVLALSILAIGGMWLARGLGVPAAVWLLLAALYLPPALVNAELRLGAPVQAVAIAFAGLAAVRLLERARSGRVQAPNPSMAGR